MNPKSSSLFRKSFGTGLWEWPLGLGVDPWEELQSQWRQISLWLLEASWMRALVTGGDQGVCGQGLFHLPEMFQD